MCLSGNCLARLSYREARVPAYLAVNWVHCILCFLARRSYLGIYQRGISQRGSCERAKPGELHTLAYDCGSILDIPPAKCPFGVRAVRFFLCHDGCAVLCCALCFSRDERHHARGNAEEAWNRINHT